MDYLPGFFSKHDRVVHNDVIVDNFDGLLKIIVVHWLLFSSRALQS